MRSTALTVLLCLLMIPAAGLFAAPVQVGFGTVDITPDVSPDAPPVWIAGYGQNRRATGVHDPLYSRAIVLKDGDRKIALVTIDLVGLQRPVVLEARKGLTDYHYVLVSSTHVHEGPDVIGLWGPTPFRSGVDKDYLKLIEGKIVESVRAAEKNLQPAKASFGIARDDNLLRDSRVPDVRDGVIRVLKFQHAETGKPIGLFVQYSCHPEAMGSRNQLLTADFIWATIQSLREKHGGEVAVFIGAVGGLMTPPSGRFSDDKGNKLVEGQWEWTEAFGKMVAALGNEALEKAVPIELSPMHASAVELFLPLANPTYRLAGSTGLLTRPMFSYTGDPYKQGQPVTDPLDTSITPSFQTEVAYIRLGDLHIAGIPGEIYPELVYGIYEDPVQENVDFPDAPLEPHVFKTLPGEHHMIIGLANDEVGYIVPKRQWDFAPPYAYGRNSPQYGEVNSVGPEVAPILAEGLIRAVGQ